MQNISLKSLLTEALENYFIAKTTDKEVEDLLLRGHYLEAWPFAGSRYKDFIFGIYRKPTSLGKSDLPLGDVAGKNVLVGCVVYGYAEHHAARYVQDWIRRLLSPDESAETFSKVVSAIVKKDEEEKVKAQQRGYEYRPKLTQTIQTFLKTINVQQEEIIELKRLYILPEHDEKNIESFAIQKCNDEVLKSHPEINVIISFSDSKVGHYGGIYQATNAAFAGFTKHGLLRYIYFRPQIADTIKRYQTSFQKIAFNYPKKSEEQPKKRMDWDFETDPELNTRVVKYLKNKMPGLENDDTKTAFQKVIDTISLDVQRGFKFK